MKLQEHDTDDSRTKWLHRIATEPEYLDENQTYNDTTGEYLFARAMGNGPVAYTYTELGDQPADTVEISLSPFDWGKLDDDLDLEHCTDAIIFLTEYGYLHHTDTILVSEHKDETGVSLSRYSCILTPTLPEETE